MSPNDEISNYLMLLRFRHLKRLICGYFYCNVKKIKQQQPEKPADAESLVADFIFYLFLDQNLKTMLCIYNTIKEMKCFNGYLVASALIGTFID